MTTKNSNKPRISDLIMHSDQQVILLNKPGGMPTQEDPSGDASLHRIAQAYCKHDLYIVHRLDRPCSGIVLFAKSKKSAAALSLQLKDHTAVKEYLAVVPKGIDPVQGRLENDLVVERGKARVVANGEGKKAVLDYHVISEIDNYTLLGITLHTGRTHQVRVQLAEAGFPVKGDVRYGARRSNPDRTIHLHSRTFSFVHPTRNERMEFSAGLPDEPVWNAFEFS